MGIIRSFQRSQRRPQLIQKRSLSKQIDELKTKLDELKKAYEDDSDISVMPENGEEFTEVRMPEKS